MKKKLNKNQKRITPWDFQLSPLTFLHILKILDIRELEQITFIHSFDKESDDFMKNYKKYTNEPYSLLVIESIVQIDYLLGFRKNQIGQITLRR